LTDNAPHSSPAKPGSTAFLSYARADQVDVTRLVAALEAAGLTLWWDKLIEGGAAFAKSIESALERCDAVIVVWSKASVASDWVLDEAGQGRDLHKLVAVSLDGTLPPLGFRQYHAVSLVGWQGNADAAAIGSIVRGVGVAGKRGEHSAGASAVRTPFTRRKALAIGAALTATSIGGVALWLRRPNSTAARRDNSVAVLPFRNISGDREQDYFSDGLSEELRVTLARDLRLLVMAQASSDKFRERKGNAVEIASQLGVSFLLDGSVRRAGDLVRITADFVDGATGFSRWSQTFDRNLRDIFAVQSEIAGTVAQALAANVESPTPASTGAVGGTGNVAAYDEYLRGRALYDVAGDEEGERAALARFDAAIVLDPKYAAAHAARARSLTAIANQYGQVDTQGGMYADAIAAARLAIELAPEFAEAHSTLGFTLFQGRLDARGAREPFELSRRLGTGSATVLGRYAQYCARVGRDRDAMEPLRSALRLDKLNPLVHRAAGAVEYAARRYAESIPPMRQALGMNARLSQAHAGVGAALFSLGRVAEAREEYRAEPYADFRLAGLAITEQNLGNTAAARAAFEELTAEHGERVLYQQAQVLAQWRDRKGALTRLDQAWQRRDSGLIYLRNDPMIDNLRGEPQFTKLLSAIGFE
jgi:TolB-like protein/tetratricopeptide (TPR) repeat protein